MLRTRTTALILAVTCAAGGTAAVATATASAARAPEASSLKLSVKSTSIGKILVENGGLVVYIFTRDKKNVDRCPASNGCASVWPPLTGKVTLGAGLKKSLLGTIKDGSKKQLTYAGHPLYGYDMNSTSVSYVGSSQFGGVWDAISATGKVVTY